MPTPPDLEKVTTLLAQLNHYSEALLQCDEKDIEGFSRLLGEREPLIAQLAEWTLDAFPPQEQKQIIPLYEKLLTADDALAERFNKLMAQQGKQIRTVHSGRRALGSYKFPVIGDHNHIENQG